jgi:hypothetical protein
MNSHGGTTGGASSTGALGAGGGVHASGGASGNAVSASSGSGGGGTGATIGPARQYLLSHGLTPTPDAIEQLDDVFLPCLQIMCTRPWSPDGETWRESGILGVLGDVRKKFTRFWYRTWTMGRRHDDSGLDLINYIGFVMRSDPDSRWGEWGEPGQKEG